jgi:hypothetical protein
MPSGGSKTQTTTQKNDPWAGAMPLLNGAVTQIQGEFGTGGPKYYGGDQVANLNATQMAGIGGITKAAGGAARMANRGTSTLNGIMNGGALEQFTSGQPNPYLGDLYQQGARGVTDDVNAQFSQAGRYGSGAQTNVLSRNLGDMWTNMASGAYENDRNRALSAAGQMDSNKLAATDRLSGMYDLSQRGNKDLIGAGSLLQNQQQNEIDAQMKAWDFNQNRNRNNIDWLRDSATQLGNVGGTQTGEGDNPNHKSAMDNILGLGSSLGAAWLMSDRRLKADIEPLGADSSGLNWYRYRYVWDEPGTERVGVMADEAPAHAVAHHAHHFSAVNYGAL